MATLYNQETNYEEMEKMRKKRQLNCRCRERNALLRCIQTAWVYTTRKGVRKVTRAMTQSLTSDCAKFVKPQLAAFGSSMAFLVYTMIT